MANLCHTCRYWRVRNESGFFMWSLDGYGECAHSKMAYCGDGEARDLAAKGNNDMLIYIGTRLVIGPDFGCVHHKEIKE